MYIFLEKYNLMETDEYGEILKHYPGGYPHTTIIEKLKLTVLALIIENPIQTWSIRHRKLTDIHLTTLTTFICYLILKYVFKRQITLTLGGKYRASKKRIPSFLQILCLILVLRMLKQWFPLNVKRGSPCTWILDPCVLWSLCIPI